MAAAWARRREAASDASGARARTGLPEGAGLLATVAVEAGAKSRLGSAARAAAASDLIGIPSRLLGLTCAKIAACLRAVAALRLLAPWLPAAALLWPAASARCAADAGGDDGATPPLDDGAAASGDSPGGNVVPNFRLSGIWRRGTERVPGGTRKPGSRTGPAGRAADARAPTIKLFMWPSPAGGITYNGCRALLGYLLARSARCKAAQK